MKNEFFLIKKSKVERKYDLHLPTQNGGLLKGCSKALGIGLRMGISWKEMHIINLKSGKPELVIEGKAKDFLIAMTPKGYTPKINVSLTDDFPWAQATVIIEGIS